MDDIEARMLQASSDLRFEEAGALRDQMQALAKVLQQQTMESDDEDTDVIAIAIAGGRVCVNLAMVRGGPHLGDKAFFPTHVEGDAPADVLEAFLSQYYLDSTMPPITVVSNPLPAESEVMELLANAG